MIKGPNCELLFWYIYRPIRCAVGIEDGGFSVALYEDGAFVFTTFNQNKAKLSTFTFLLPLDVCERYHDVINDAKSWLSRIPLNLRADHQPLYASILGLYGYPLIKTEELGENVKKPFGDQSGFYNRRLFLLLEDIHMILADYGITLLYNGFVWDSTRIEALSTQDERSMH